MKEKAEPQIASLTQTRDTLVKLRTALKNKINKILKYAANFPSSAKSSMSPISDSPTLAPSFPMPLGQIAVAFQLLAAFWTVCSSF